MGQREHINPLLESIDRAVIATGPDRRIVYWNHLAEKLYGWTADEVYGRDILEITPVDTSLGEEVLRPVEDGGNWSGKFTVRRKDGTAFPAFVSITTIRDEKGAPAGVLGLSYAIAQPDSEINGNANSAAAEERPKPAREALSEAEKRQSHYDVLFEEMSEGFALCEAIRDESGNLVDYALLEINPALQKMLGVGPEVIGARASASGTNTADWLSRCDAVLRTGVSHRFEYHNEQTGRWHDIHIDRVTNDRLAQFFHDITERKTAEFHREHLLAELNHRVKNHLTMIGGVLRMQARNTDDPIVREQLLSAVGRVQSISEVHRSLYEDSRDGNVDFGAYVEELCAKLAGSLIDPPGRITLKVVAEHDELSVDTATPLGMVVNELVTNALKYAYPPPQRGVISVRFKKEADGHLLEIGDSGVGLPNNVETATGLGMKMIRSLVQQVDGSLTAVHHPGVTFTIRFAAVDKESDEQK